MPRFLDGSLVVRSLTRGMQLFLLAALLVGVDRRHVGIVFNCGLALVVTLLPGSVERRSGVRLDQWAHLLVALPAFLHGVGIYYGLYRPGLSWDVLTHTLSGAVVACVGYTVVRGYDLADGGRGHPRRRYAVTLAFVLALGVGWEAVEFGLVRLGERYGFSVIGQPGPWDTVTDVGFDVLGGALVVLAGTRYLRTHAERVADAFDRGG